MISVEREEMTNTPEKKMVKVNIGSGMNKLEGFINVDIAKENNPEIIHDLNKTPYPFKANSVDYINSTFVIEHLMIHPIDFLRECHRMLKHRGKMRISTDNFLSYKNRIKLLFGNWDKADCYHPYHGWFFDYKYFEKLCKHVGFTVWHRNKTRKILPFLEKLSPSLFANSMDLVLWKHSER